MFLHLPQSVLIDFVIIITEWREVGYFCAASCDCEWHRAFICVLMCPPWCASESGEEGQRKSLAQQVPGLNSQQWPVVCSLHADSMGVVVDL